MPSVILMSILLLAMLVTGLVAVVAPNLFGGVVMFGAYSFFTVLVYLLLLAPDVAFTESIISIFSTLFFIATLVEIKRRKNS